MQIADKIVKVFKRHPDWSSALIAAEVGCISAYVRVTLNRRGIALNSNVTRPNPRSKRNSEGWRIPNDGTKAKAIYDLYRSGVSPSEICRRLKMDANSVNPMISRMKKAT